MSDDDQRSSRNLREGQAETNRGPIEPGQSTRRLIVTRGSDVKLKPLVWWEPGLILCAAINLVSGREGKGKSTITASWVARETRAGGTVLWIGSEEPREQAIAPRLVAADADMDRVIFIDVETDLATRALVFPLDLVAIEKTIQEHDVTMIVLDPAKGAMEPGFSGGNDDIAVRQYLEPIAALAGRRNLVILALVHFGKREGADSGKLILGSIAWSQVARSVLSIAEDPDTGHRIITATKGNYTATERSIEYRFVSRTVHTDEGPTEIGAAEFLGETTKDARDYLAGHDPDDTRDIDQWLTEFLRPGSKKANDVYQAADAAGYSKDQAKRAKKRLGVKAERPSGDGPWFWSMPDQGSTDQGSTPHVQNGAPLLPCTSERVRNTEFRPREHSAHDRSLGASLLPSHTVTSGALTDATPGMTDRVRLALAKARRGGNSPDTACDVCRVELIRPESITAGLCAECQVTTGGAA